MSDSGNVGVPAWIVYRALRHAGFGASHAEVMVSICYGESSLHLDAWHREANCSTSDGIWQLNTVHHFPVATCYSLLGATRLAKRIYDSQGYGAWGAWNNNSYRRYRDEADAARTRAGREGAVPDMPGSRRAELVPLNPRVTAGGRRILVASWVKARAENLAVGSGTVITSGYRTRAQNEAVDGAPNSDHLCGFATDHAGSRSAINEAERRARARGAAFVLDEGDHCHVSWRRCGAAVVVGEQGPKTPPPLDLPVTVEAGWAHLTRAWGRVIPRRADAVEQIARGLTRKVR